MQMNGWIKLYRQIQDCWLWQEKPYDKCRAWIDLLLLANHEDKKVNFDGKPIVVSRGQYLTSIRKLSERWGWSYDKTFRFLNVLESDDMLRKESNNSRTLLTIENYVLFQGVPNADNGTDRTPTSEHSEYEQANTPISCRTPTSDKQEEKNKRTKEDNKKGKVETTEQIFERLLPNYPISDVLADKLREWIKYKTERKDSYKEHGMKSLLNQILTHTEKYGDTAVCSLIDECMANGWKGIIWDKLKNNQRYYSTADRIGNRVNDVDNW